MFCFVRCSAMMCSCSTGSSTLTFDTVRQTMFGTNPDFQTIPYTMVRPFRFGSVRLNVGQLWFCQFGSNLLVRFCQFRFDYWFWFGVPGVPRGPMRPIGPCGAMGPMGPVGPWGPMRPMGPWGPMGPWAPVGPWGPWGPMGPMGPWGYS